MPNRQLFGRKTELKVVIMEIRLPNLNLKEVTMEIRGHFTA
jgi:hypothetical protein